MKAPEFVSRVLDLYARTLRTYAQRAPLLLALGAIVFLPLGLLEGISLDIDVGDASLGNGLLVLGILAIVGLVTATSLIGEIFYSGAVAILLTRSTQDEKLTLGDVARRISYGRLIVVDLVFTLLVVLGLSLLVVPGVIVFSWFVLAGTVVEIEDRGVRAAFARSRALARGRFLTVLTALGLLQLVEESVSGGVAAAGEAIFGHGFLAGWLLESAANVALAPVYAVAAVLLALDLIAAKDGTAARIESSATHR